MKLVSKRSFSSSLCALCALCVSTTFAAEPQFKKLTLTDKFYSEAATFGDLNKDGKMDVVAGPYWYEGPDFQTKHEYYKAEAIDPLKYSQNMVAFTDDINHDGWTDILIVGFPGDKTKWFENPQGKDGLWPEHVAFDVTDDESPTYGDIDGDGQKELICANSGQMGYAKPDSSDPAKKWAWHGVTPNQGFQRFTHGIGIGDVNGDGKMDILENTGWWEQPASIGVNAGPQLPWKKHDARFADAGAAMYVYDVNGDGLNDVISSWHAHQYGIAWQEQKKDGDKTEWIKHLIVGSPDEKGETGVVFSQAHALELVDINGDGLMDLVSGKRHWAHGDHGDPEPNAPAVLYWFELKRDNGKATYTAHKIDDASGVGTQVVAGDLNADKKPDIIVGNKLGTFVFLQAGDLDDAKK
jgi:hypothetical protein